MSERDVAMEKLMGRTMPVSELIWAERAHFIRNTMRAPNVLVIHPYWASELKNEISSRLTIDGFANNLTYLGMRVYLSTCVTDFDISMSAEK